MECKQVHQFHNSRFRTLEWFFFPFFFFFFSREKQENEMKLLSFQLVSVGKHSLGTDSIFFEKLKFIINP